MRVGAERGRDPFVPEALLDQNGVGSHVYEEGGVGVPDVVNPNDLHAGALAATLQLFL